jgi:hypothetical protein
MSGKADALIRQALGKAGVAVPVDVNLDLAKYLNNRGVKPLNFQPKAEFTDPFGNQDKLTPRASLGIPSGGEAVPAKPEEKK